MTVRVVTVGINEYEGNALSGCVNDSKFLATDLCNLFGYRPGSDVRMLLDKRATKDAIIKRLEWLSYNTRAGETGIPHLSCHGTQVASRCMDEVDGLDECLVPYDFDWNDDSTWITDDDFIEAIRPKWPGARMLVILDSCCSGDMIDQGTDRVIVKAKDNHGIDVYWDEHRKPRFLAPPADIAWRKRANPPVRSVLSRIAELPGVALLAGCQSSGTCSDAYIDNEPQGAFTWALRQGLLLSYQKDPSTVREIMDDARAYLIEKGFKQVPVESGDTRVLDQPWPR